MSELWERLLDAKAPHSAVDATVTSLKMARRILGPLYLKHALLTLEKEGLLVHATMPLAGDEPGSVHLGDCAACKLLKEARQP